MSGPAPQFPDYGERGDLAGARRSRRAFRLCVAACVFLTISLWFTEEYLRYDHAERLYLKALTLPRESARVLLLQAIKVDAENRERPTPRYTQALAVRQEEDVILDTYAKGYSMDPTDTMFAIRYGCRLFQMGQAGKAAEIFRNAGGQPTDNALVGYIEAASIAQAADGDEGLKDAMVLVARTNNSGDDLIFPRPLWYSTVLPQDGYWYARLQRDIYSEVCAPLYVFQEQVVRAVERQVRDDQLQNAQTWLEQIRILGQRLVADSEPRSTLVAMAGMRIQLRALEQLEAMESAASAVEIARLAERRENIEEALEVATRFEKSRDAQIEEAATEVWTPVRLVFAGGVFLFGIHFLTIAIYKIARMKKSAWALPHSPIGKSILAGGAVVMFLLLHVHTLLQRIPGAQLEYANVAASLWWAVLVVLVAFGWIYPALTLKGVREVSRKSGRPEEMSHTMHLARRAYRRAYGSMILRYKGILVGLFVIVACLWYLTYRIATGLYPAQEKLLVTGLLGREQEVVNQVLQLLG